MTQKETFCEIFQQLVTRKGADKLLSWLEQGDFFTAPASTRYHLAEDGGLCAHSLHVYQRLDTLVKAEALDASPESIAICGLLHDLCKTGFYKKEMRNIKVNGVWKEMPYFSIDDQFPYGHGEKSVFLIERFIRLTTEEAMAIRWHMGGYDEAVKGGSYAINGAYNTFPLAVCLHIADIQATYLDEGPKEHGIRGEKEAN